MRSPDPDFSEAVELSMPRKECRMGPMSGKLRWDELAGSVNNRRDAFSVIDLAVNDYAQVVAETY